MQVLLDVYTPHMTQLWRVQCVYLSYVFAHLGLFLNSSCRNIGRSNLLCDSSCFVVLNVRAPQLHTKNHIHVTNNLNDYCTGGHGIMIIARGEIILLSYLVKGLGLSRVDVAQHADDRCAQFVEWDLLLRILAPLFHSFFCAMSCLLRCCLVIIRLRLGRTLATAITTWTTTYQQVILHSIVDE